MRTFKIQNDSLAGILPDQTVYQKVHGSLLSALRTGGREEVDQPARGVCDQVHCTDFPLGIANHQDAARLSFEEGMAKLAEYLLMMLGKPKFFLVVPQIKIQEGR